MGDVNDDDSWLYGNSEGTGKKGIEELATDVNSAISTNNTKAAPPNNDAITDVEMINTNAADDEKVPVEIDKEQSKLVTDEDQPSNHKVDADTTGQLEKSISINLLNDNNNAEASDDSEDDVQVTIGAITPGPSPSDAGRNYYRNPVQVIGTPKAVVGKGVDLNAPGNINGEPVLDFDLDSLEEKPWRKPGAYLSSFFNYGFNETTWKMYCFKQKKMRADSGLPSTPKSSISANRTSSIISSILAKYEKPKIAAPISSSAASPVISVPTPVAPRSITTLSTPRNATAVQTEVVTSVAEAVTVPASTPSSVIASAVLHVPTTTPVYTIPPAVTGAPLPAQFDPTKPPPSLPIGLPLPGYPGAPILPPGINPPGTELISLPPSSEAQYLHPPGTYVPPASGQAPQTIGGPENGEERQSQSDDSRDYRSSRRDYERDRDRYSRRDYRERSRERDRDRDRERDRDRVRERDRDRDRERDRERDRRRRDDSPDRYRSSRRKNDDERYSKHKKAKKPKHRVKEERISDEERFFTEDQIKREPVDD